jgi:hypothetical protein
MKNADELGNLVGEKEAKGMVTFFGSGKIISPRGTSVRH